MELSCNVGSEAERGGDRPQPFSSAQSGTPASHLSDNKTRCCSAELQRDVFRAAPYAAEAGFQWSRSLPTIMRLSLHPGSLALLKEPADEAQERGLSHSSRRCMVTKTL